ncbi:hypothetical protein [Aporhodopirellula aestuarii]|uniref:Uncharacterized protein n=1 Tax=Aporhodopirellula aestuarii TaxID=2950107 RepID=A0ABT0U441_9BACT|nr:hypothetical protein [Aporhodopirellula aestuarii]MCM2371684.1 hypothetical protein [Aporhodopirellula aestuarii]
MTQRERYLSIAIGGLFVVIGFQWAFNQYRSAIRFRQNRLNSLANETENLQAQWLAGAEAERQLGEYKIRSLSSDTEVAKSSYQSWLLETVGRLGIADAIVDPVGDSPVGDLYTKFGFRVSGKTNLKGLVDLVYAIQSRDQLHRIRELQFAPVRQGVRRADAKTNENAETLNVLLTLDAISMSIADASPPPPSQTPSWRITRSLADSRDVILNRNLFQPPNQPPQYRGEEQIVAFRGEKNSVTFPFVDPENDSVSVRVEGYFPEWVEWDTDSERLIVTPPRENTEDGSDDDGDTKTAMIDQFELQVIATDNGYPRRQTTQTMVVKMRSPPPPPAPQTPPPGFDDATQTFLTALVQGRDDWTAWMNVRTRGKTLKLKIGDEFEIGSVRGKVTGVTSRRVSLEINGQTYELRPAEKLSDVLAEDET